MSGGFGLSFGPEEASHLLRRAGFGGSWEEAERASRAGLSATVERLFGEDEGRESERAAAAAETLCELNDVETLQALWLVRMRSTQAAGREKLALFLHGHFATSWEKVQSMELMWRQYRLLHERGAGPFGELVEEMARDPAMLVWLDSNSNRKGKPNENFARELMELFTLGLGAYTEQDVREAARAFSGWHVRKGDFWFNRRAHDDGIKEVLGERVTTGEEVVALCVRQAACARFLAGELTRFYVCSDPDVRPGPGRVLRERLAAWLLEDGLVIGKVLRRLFTCPEFYDSAVRRTVIKSPVDFAVGALRALDARCSTRRLAQVLREMGQGLFAPPSVEGWDGGRAWINSHTLLVRQRFAEGLAFGGQDLSSRVEWTRLARAGTSAALVSDVVRAVHQEELADGTLRTLVRVVEQGGGPSPGTARELVHLVMTLPEYQLS